MAVGTTVASLPRRRLLHEQQTELQQDDSDIGRTPHHGSPGPASRRTDRGRRNGNRQPCPCRYEPCGLEPGSRATCLRPPRRHPRPRKPLIIRPIGPEPRLKTFPGRSAHLLAALEWRRRTSTRPAVGQSRRLNRTGNCRYDRNDVLGHGSGNSRNGTQPKKVLTDTCGTVQIDVPGIARCARSWLTGRR